MDHLADLLSEVRLFSDTDLPHYTDCVRKAHQKIEPVFMKARYADFFFHCASSVPGWLARVVLANADAESQGSQKLHYLWRGAISNQRVSSDVLEHARDEAGHCRMFVALVEAIFPGLYTKAALNEKRAGMFRLDHDALNAERFQLDEAELIDHLIQMNMGEIRTRIHMQLLSPVLFAFTPQDAQLSVSHTLQRLVTDEVRHINYTAQFIEAWCENGDSNRIVALYEDRLREFHHFTIHQTEAAVRAYGNGEFPDILEI